MRAPMNCSRSAACSANIKRGVFEAAARLGERDNDALDNTRREVELLGEISRENGVAVTFGLTESARRPDLFRRVIEVCERENARGANLRPQTTSRGIGVLFGIHHRTPYDRFPAWQELRGKSLAERLDLLRRNRAELIAAVDDQRRHDAARPALRAAAGRRDVSQRPRALARRARAPAQRRAPSPHSSISRSKRTAARRVTSRS